MRAVVFAIALSLLPLHASATNSRPELMKVLEDLMAWLPGEYTSVPQVFLERNLGAPPDGEHEIVYRVFARIEAPHLAEHVIYTQIRLDGDDGPVFPGQQVVFLISVNVELGAVAISGRRIKDQKKFVDAHLRPDVWSDLEPDPDFGGNCMFNWRRHGKQLRGLLGEFGECTMVSKNTGHQMTWDAEWILNPEELWVYDNGYLEDGSLISGREDRTHLRMYKARRFECFTALRFEDGSNQVINPYFMHDRGDFFTITTNEPEPRELHVEFPDLSVAVRFRAQLCRPHAPHACMTESRANIRKRMSSVLPGQHRKAAGWASPPNGPPPGANWPTRKIRGSSKRCGGKVRTNAPLI